VPVPRDLGQRDYDFDVALDDPDAVVKVKKVEDQ
jgi:hypothetical protein